MDRTFTIRDAVPVPMRDGVELVCDMWLPAGDGPWPVLLQRTPYRRETPFGAQYISALEFQSALRRGYAVVVQDTRGRYASGGDFDPFVAEGPDGADTIRWLCAQEFCDGRVAMFGGSYVGATQVLAAAERPEGLVAISPHLTTARHGDTWMYRGGAIELGFLLLWIIEALAIPDLDRRLPKAEAAMAARLQDFHASLLRDPAEAFARLPVLEADLVALAPYAATWFDAARAAASADDREHLDALAQSPARMLVSAGWNDLFVEGSLELFALARGRHTDAGAVSDRLIVGPWSHGNPTDWQGARWHGYTASTALLPEAQLDFFDAALAQVPPKGAMVRYFRTGSDTWHDAADWPIPGTSDRVMHLDGDRLSDALPIAAWSRSYVADPSDPVPTCGGATFLPGLLLGRNSGQIDQTRVESRGDVLVFTSAPLDAALDMTGLVTVELWVQSDAPTCDWTARLCEVDEDGISRGLVDGILRWTNPGPGDVPHSVSVRLGHISHLAAKGNRLRLQIASSNFPRFDRNPQSKVSAPYARLSDLRSARNRVEGGPSQSSVLTIQCLEWETA